MSLLILLICLCIIVINHMYIRSFHGLFILVLVLIATDSQAQKVKIYDYIETYKDIAIREMNRSGIPASITLAQGIHESAFGNSSLAKEANNHFGIKCGGRWEGKEYYKWDDDPNQSCFRVYGSAESSYIDHTDFLMKNSRYGFLFDYEKTDYKNWAKGLKKAGYATDPKYPSKLIATVEKYDLQIYDNADLSIADVVENTSEEIFRSKKWSFLFTERQKGFGIQNGASYVSAREGETSLQTAERWGIPYRKFLRFNDLRDGDGLMVHQRIYIAPKKSQYQGEERFHSVEHDETMYEIAQFYGIKLSPLLERNLMADGEEPEQGTIILLKDKRDTPPELRPTDHVDLIPDFAQAKIDSTTNADNNNITPIVVVEDIKRPEPEDLKINTPLYKDKIYTDTINTSKDSLDNFEPIDIPKEQIEKILKDTVLPGTLFPKSDADPADNSNVKDDNSDLTNSDNVDNNNTNTGSTDSKQPDDNDSGMFGMFGNDNSDFGGTDNNNSDTDNSNQPDNNDSGMFGMFGNDNSDFGDTDNNNSDSNTGNTIENTDNAYASYTVQSGDSLSLIAYRKKTSISKIKQLNQLRSDVIYPGQKLKIPN